VKTATSIVDLAFVCCPCADHGSLKESSQETLTCVSCGRSFPLVKGRPVLFDEARSIFSATQIVSLGDQKQFSDGSGWRLRLRNLFPAASSRDFSVALLESQKSLLTEASTVLVIGCGLTGQQYRKMFSVQRLFLTDVSLKGDADLACDGESLPFPNESLDCVFIDQVLEHALNPLAVVEEIYRCLKFGGIVYSGVPFHTPVHAFPFDFQRYTPLGHRLLFRQFQELDFCVTQGPVSALSLTLIGFLTSFSDNLWWRRLSSVAVRILVGSMRWLDHRFTAPRELTIPAASAFLGRKQREVADPMTIISSWGVEENQRRTAMEGLPSAPVLSCAVERSRPE
jgi:SAM-dependent methyltransferase